MMVLALVVSMTTLAQASAPGGKEPITLRVLIDQSTDWNDFPDNPVAQEIKRLTGITIEFVSADKDKVNLMIAGGDLPDIIMARNDETNQQFGQLIEGNNVIPLDDLLQTNGQNILAQQSEMLDFSKKFWSNGTGNVYYLSTNIGKEMGGMELSYGAVMRWDYYKELGYPQMSSTDDVLDVVEQMLKAHPATEDGKPMYGISFWSDWGNWSYGMMLSMLNKHDNVWLPLNSRENVHWKGIEFLYKANQRGLLDPDALVQGSEDMHTKATNGQVLYGCVSWPWPFDTFNNEHAKDGVGYMSVPLEFGSIWNGADYYAGYSNKGFAITTNCKYPDRAMDLFNLLWSYDGARLVFSGVEGTHWDVKEDGKAHENQTYIDLLKDQPDQWQALKLGGNGSLNIMVGFNAWTLHPDDNSPMDLYKSEEVYAASMTKLQRDFSEHYGVEYPLQAFQKLVDEGKVKDMGDSNVYLDSMMPPRPDDLNTINGRADGYLFTAFTKCIMSASDEEFEANVQQAIDDINAMGYQDFADWYSAEHLKAKEIVGIK